MALEGVIRGKIDSIAERKIDGIDITVLNLRDKDGHLHIAYSDGPNLDYFIGQEVDVWRKVVDFKKGVLIVKQRIYRDAGGKYIVREDYQEYPINHPY